MLYYLRCSFDGTRAGKEKMGTFSFLIDADTKEVAVEKLVDALKAGRKEEPDFFPSSGCVYVDDLVEILDPLDVGLIFNAEEQDYKEGLEVGGFRSMPAGYESKAYEGETTDGGVCIPIFTYGRKKK